MLLTASQVLSHSQKALTIGPFFLHLLNLRCMTSVKRNPPQLHLHVISLSILPQGRRLAKILWRNKKREVHDRVPTPHPLLRRCSAAHRARCRPPQFPKILHNLPETLQSHPLHGTPITDKTGRAPRPPTSPARIAPPRLPLAVSRHPRRLQPLLPLLRQLPTTKLPYRPHLRPPGGCLPNNNEKSKNAKPPRVLLPPGVPDLRSLPLNLHLQMELLDHLFFSAHNRREQVCRRQECRRCRARIIPSLRTKAARATLLASLLNV